MSNVSESLSLSTKARPEKIEESQPPEPHTQEAWIIEWVQDVVTLDCNFEAKIRSNKTNSNMSVRNSFTFNLQPFKIVCLFVLIIKRVRLWGRDETIVACPPSRESRVVSQWEQVKLIPLRGKMRDGKMCVGKMGSQIRQWVPSHGLLNGTPLSHKNEGDILWGKVCLRGRRSPGPNLRHEFGLRHAISRDSAFPFGMPKEGKYFRQKNCQHSQTLAS